MLPNAEEIPLLWPDTITYPARPPRLVYLDLNHWINLARCRFGMSTPHGYDRLLRASFGAKECNEAMFVLSDTIYVEMALVKDPTQRAGVAAMIEDLTDFQVILGRLTIAELEFEAAILHLAPAGARLPIGIPLLGHSMLWAFGMRGGLVLRDQDGNDITQEMVAHGGTDFRTEFARIERSAETMLLRGPSDSEAQELLFKGYRLEAQVTSRRAEQEREQAERLDQDPRWRRGRLRDVVAAREVAVEWADVMNRAMAERAMTFGQLIGEDRNMMRAFADGMPSSRVATTLKTHYHRNGAHRWTTNDIHDIDALAVAVPYCDAVLTDKAARNALAVSPEIKPLGTFLPRTPGDLAAWLERPSSPEQGAS